MTTVSDGSSVRELRASRAFKSLNGQFPQKIITKSLSKITKDRTNLVIVGEKNLHRIFWLLLRRQRIIIIGSEPAFPPFRRILNWLSAKITQTGFGEDPEKNLSPNDKQISRLWPASKPGMFSSIEPHMEQQFGFKKFSGQLSGAYAKAVKHAICGHVDNQLNVVSRVRFFEERLGKDNTIVFGMSKNLINWYELVYGEIPHCHNGKRLKTSPSFNLILGLSIALYMIVWTAIHTRFRPHQRQYIPLGADFAVDSRYMNLLGEVTDETDQLLFMYRNKHLKLAAKKWHKRWGFNGYLQTSGRLDPVQAIQLLINVIWDLIKVSRYAISQPGMLSLELMKLPSKRMIYFALLNRFRFDYFFSKDDYNAEHIIRTDELRKAGVVSLGMNHGLPVPESVRGLWRYLDYDIYYTFGKHLYHNYYKDTWSDQMKVKAVGSFGMTRAQLECLKDPRPKDIVYFETTTLDDHIPYSWIIQIARHFHDRNVYIKHKRSRNGVLHPRDHRVDEPSTPQNLIEIGANTYDVMLKTSYAFTTPNSTVPAECIQFGLATFVWDATDQYEFSYYRDFPGLCVTSARQFIERVEAIENGDWIYPFEKYGELIDMSGRPVFDSIREDLNFVCSVTPNEEKKSLNTLT